MAECNCGNKVEFNGQECSECFFSRFITYANNYHGKQGRKRLIAELHRVDGRQEVETSLPALFLTGVDGVVITSGAK